MKLVTTYLALFIFLMNSSWAAPSSYSLISVKERLRLHMWSFGINESPRTKLKKEGRRRLPEEIERALSKI